jgi:hypothetical protein
MAETPIQRTERPWYLKKRTYAKIILSALIGCILAIVIAFERSPDRLVQTILHYGHLPVGIRRTQWDQGKLVFRGIRMPGGERENAYLKIRRVSLQWSWMELLFGQRVASIEIEKPEIWVDRMNKALGTKSEPASNQAAASKSDPLGRFAVTDLKISQATITLDNLGDNIPPIPITLGKNKPIELKDVRLGRSSHSDGDDIEHSATIQDLTISSPYDPMSPVLHFEVINLRFTWNELRENIISGVEFIGPTIYVGPDLFAFTDEFGKNRSTDKGQSTPWLIKRFDLWAGHLSINAFGQPGITFPFTFVSSAKDIRLDQLDKITLENKIIVPSQDRSYPEYKVKWEDLHGELAFSLPLGDAKAENLVNTLHVKKLSWNDIDVTDAWSSVTFDRKGIYGRVEGNCHGGYLASDFAVYFDAGFPWNGHFFVLGVDSAPIATKLAPSYLALSGKLQGELTVQGRSRDVVKSFGKLQLEPPGVLEIKSIDQLKQRLPADWNFVKRDLTKILLDSFRRYNYTSGVLSLDYQPPRAVGKLTFQGLQGSRDFTVNWHFGAESPESSEVAKRH